MLISLCDDSGHVYDYYTDLGEGGGRGPRNGSVLEKRAGARHMMRGKHFLLVES